MTITDTEVPTTCRKCGQPLLLRAPGRDVCERCRLGRTPQPPIEVVDPEAGGDVPRERVPCSGCGRTTVEGHDDLPLALADGYCLSCRVQGRHDG